MLNCILSLISCSINEDFKKESTLETNSIVNNQELIIKSNDLDEWIDPTIDESKITSIYCWSNALKVIPDEIMRFKNLNFIWILSRNLENFFVDIGKLPHLKKLLIGSLTIDELNSTIINLKNLRDLKISYDKCFIHDNSDCIDFKNKTSFNEITELNFNEDEFKNLEDLEIKIRYLTPDGIIHCIKSLPDEICTLKKLESLVIFNQKLETLPINIGNLENLKILDLSLCFISKLPDSFCKLKNLEKLILSDHNLTALDSGIANFEKLKVLEMGRVNNLKNAKNFKEDVDFDFSKLKSLQYLNLNRLYIKRIHKSILNLKNSIMMISLVGNKLFENDEGDFIGANTLFREFGDRLNLIN